MEIHIGQEIEKAFHKSGLKMPVFADRINTGERNVYSLFKRKDINAGQLKQIGEVLGIDFFKLYSDNYSENVIEDSQQGYNKKTSNMIKIPFSLDIAGTIAAFDKFPELLRRTKEVAEELGFIIV